MPIDREKKKDRKKKNERRSKANNCLLIEKMKEDQEARKCFIDERIRTKVKWKGAAIPNVQSKQKGNIPVREENEQYKRRIDKRTKARVQGKEGRIPQ